MPKDQQRNFYLFLIAVLVIIISVLHYSTSTQKWQFHLIYMQAYFIPIILAAFQFGIRGGLGSAIIVSLIYLPHIMFQWGGLVENNLMRFMQIVLFNIVGYLTGLKARGEQREKERYQKTAIELESALKNQVKQLEQLTEMEESLRAADRLAVVGELTASLAHEVRNPLGSIRGAVEIIRESVPDDIKKMEFFDILIDDTKRLNRVVETYLGFSGQPVKTSSEFDAIRFLQNSILMIAAQARKNRITIQTSLPEYPVMIHGNPDQFWQVCMNILLNALQFTAEGGVVHVACQTKADRTVVVSIKDDGAGIDNASLDKIFKAFYTTRDNGSGLGLAIVKRNCDENGWKINVKSKPGEGADFIIEIAEKKG